MGKCTYCGAALANRRATTCKRVDCQRARGRRYAAERLARQKSAADPRTCEGCGKALPTSMRSDARHCSRDCIDTRRSRLGERLEWQQSTKSRRLANQRVWRACNRAVVAGYKAKRRSLEATGRISSRDWDALVARYRGRCAYCDAAGPITMDHVVPLVRGGRHTIGNVLPACGPCNFSKGDKLLAEWRHHRALARSTA